MRSSQISFCQKVGSSQPEAVPDDHWLQDTSSNSIAFPKSHDLFQHLTTPTVTEFSLSSKHRTHQLSLLFFIPTVVEMKYIHFLFASDLTGS